VKPFALAGWSTLPDRSASEHSALAAVARKHPRTVVCLLSVLRFHEVMTQAPFEVWLAIPNKARDTRLENLHRSRPLSILRFSERALIEGIEEQLIGGVPVRVTKLARTVAD